MSLHQLSIYPIQNSWWYNLDQVLILFDYDGAMGRTYYLLKNLHISLGLPGRIPVVLNLTWLIVLPVGFWVIAAYYMPIFGAFLNPNQTWAVTFLIMLVAGLSLMCHTWAHTYAAKIGKSDLPSSISLFLFGDAAQAWPAGAIPRGEAFAAAAGPFANLCLAGLAFLVWNAQLNTYLNLCMLFLCGFNLWLVVINLAPCYPFDGGRLVMATLWGMAGRPAAADKLSVRMGYLMAGVLTIWGTFLLAQRSRFSPETGGVTLMFVLLILVGMGTEQARDRDSHFLDDNSRRFRPVPLLISGLVMLVMLGLASSLLLTNNGLEAPGLALSVEPMVEVPPEHYHQHAGTFILTSVLSQAPIIAGEWLVGQLSPAVKIVPPENIVPKNSTPQEIARQGYDQLDQSETAAIVVGLRLAGFKADILGKGAVVVSILPDSPASTILQPGDVIVGLNENPIRTPNDLIGQINGQDAHAVVHLQIERSQIKEEVAIPLMPPSTPNGPPRIGITIDQAGYETSLPFPVKITPEKIVGGPSAGLMFALTVYNALTSQDLTGGRKIAGTGTINIDGTVGPIGGVQQKVAAAEAAGAQYFLSPAENYSDAVSAARRIQVVKIASAEQAVEFLRSLSPAPVSK